jgi:hypothetical protein
MIASMLTRDLAVLTLTVGVLSVQEPGRPLWLPQVEHIASPAAADSAQPQLSVSHRGALLSWVEKQGQTAVLKFSERTHSGWSKPATVASGSDWFVNWADVPSVIRLDQGAVVAHWLQKSGPDPYAYDVRLSYSKDDGRTWSKSFAPHSDGTRTEHGFASLFQMPDGGLGLIWLDGRGMKPESSHDSHSEDRGAMSVRFAAFNDNWKQLSEVPVDMRVCECCPTAAAMTADGPIAAFRNRTEQEVRDIYVSRFEQGNWTEPEEVFEDGWTIAACPVNGPMLSARGRSVAIAWFTVKEGQGRASIAFSTDAGRSFKPPIRLDDNGALGRVDVELMPDGSAVASWIEYAGERAQFRARRVEASGAKSPAITVSGVAGNRASGYPRIARHDDELVFAWTETAGGRSRVQTAVARLPAATER